MAAIDPLLTLTPYHTTTDTIFGKHTEDLIKVLSTLSKDRRLFCELTQHLASDVHGK